MNIKATGIAAIAALATIASVSGVSSVSADSRSAFVVSDATTKAECTACHLAYGPGFLPKRSWQAIIGDLSNHFGEDASLDAATQQQIMNYMVSMAPQDIRGVPASITPMRITDMAWFNHEHGSNRIAYAKSHAAIGTISNCTGCHRGAEQGFFGD